MGYKLKTMQRTIFYNIRTFEERWRVDCTNSSKVTAPTVIKSNLIYRSQIWTYICEADNMKWCYQLVLGSDTKTTKMCIFEIIVEHELQRTVNCTE